MRRAASSSILASSGDEATLNDLPSIPAAYVESAAFVSAAGSGDPYPPIVDGGDFDDDAFGEALQPAGGPDTPANWSQRAGAGRKGR